MAAQGQVWRGQAGGKASALSKYRVVEMVPAGTLISKGRRGGDA